MKKLIFAANSEFGNQASMKCSHCDFFCSNKTKISSCCGNKLDGLTNHPIVVTAPPASVTQKTFLQAGDYPDKHQRINKSRFLFWTSFATTANALSFFFRSNCSSIIYNKHLCGYCTFLGSEDPLYEHYDTLDNFGSFQAEENLTGTSLFTFPLPFISRIITFSIYLRILRTKSKIPVLKQ